MFLQKDKRLKAIFENLVTVKLGWGGGYKLFLLYIVPFKVAVNASILWNASWLFLN